MLVRSERDGRARDRRRAARTASTRSAVEGEDPLAPFGPNAAGHVRRTDGFPHCPDIVVNSTYWAETERGRRLRGAGRLARRHGRAAVATRSCCHPADLAWPGRAEVVGAERVHRVFRGWLAELGQSDYADVGAD